MSSVEKYDSNQNGTGLAGYQSPQALAVRPRTVQRLTEWAESAQAAFQVAERLCKTSFVPEQFRNKPEETTAAILAGDEVGLSPMASLRSFDIIYGTAAPRAITLRAIVQSKGHAVWQVEATDARAVFRGRRAGESEVHESVWTIERAHEMGLLGNQGWKKGRKTMLIARATSEVCRLTAADAILGIPYSVEELSDGVVGDWSPSEAPSPQQGVPAVTAGPRTAQRRTKPAAKAAPQSATPPSVQQLPPLPGEEDEEEPARESPPASTSSPDPAHHQVRAPDDDAPEGIRKAQLTKLHTIFSNAGIQSRDTKLRAAVLIVGREVESSTQLTKDEAIRLIDTLEREDQEGDLAEFVAELVGRGDEQPSETPDPGGA